MKRLAVLLVALAATTAPSNAQSRTNSFPLRTSPEAQSLPSPNQTVKFVIPFDINISGRVSISPDIADFRRAELKQRIVEAALINFQQSIKESLSRIEQEPGGNGKAITEPSSISAKPVEIPQKKSSYITPNGHSKFHWGPAIKQSLLFLGIQHGYALTQPKTRRNLRGPFLKDYFESLGNLKGWADGGRFFTNYIAHPMQGSMTGFIQIHNDPKGMREEFGRSKNYWKSRMKAMAWSAAWSTQFELGPISQASIGNVGKSRKLTYVDLVITPTAGSALLVTEDAMDRYVVRWIERRTNRLAVRIPTRMLLNPTRTCANLLRFKKPWHRDTR
ncbi:MAG: hypothetical protein H0T92_20525 [Pyrinomonadaceae bacterium]|nr:hypothetical protein [Pyrinomonadaceae bacterium]